VTEQTRYAVKVRQPDHAEPEWASLLAARIAPLLDASPVEVVTALVNHAPIAPDSSFEDAEHLVTHLRTLGITGVLVERPATLTRRADVADRGTLKGLLPIPSDTPENGRNTQPFMFANGSPPPRSQATPVAMASGRTQPPRQTPRSGYGSYASQSDLSMDGHGTGSSPSVGHPSQSGRQGDGLHTPQPAAPHSLGSGHWGAVTPARIQERGTKPGSPAPHQGWGFGGDTRPKTDSYQLNGQALSRPPNRQTQRLPDPEVGDGDTTHWTPIAPDTDTFGWPPGGQGPGQRIEQTGYAAPNPPVTAYPPEVGNYHPPSTPYLSGRGAPTHADEPAKSRSNRSTPAMPEMAASQPVEPPFQGPSATYIPTSGPRPAIPSATPTDPLGHDPGMAALLSTFLPGMGQVYNGQRDRGIVFALTALFVVPWILGIVDAWHQAACIRRGEVPVPAPHIWRSARWSQLVLDIAVFTAILVAVDLWVGSRGVLRSPSPPPITAPPQP